MEERELRQLRGCGHDGAMPLWYWRYYFSAILNRSVTDAETLDAIRQMNGPAESPAHTYGQLTRTTEPWKWR